MTDFAPPLPNTPVADDELFRASVRSALEARHAPANFARGEKAVERLVEEGGNPDHMRVGGTEPIPFVGCSVDVAAEMFDTRVEHMGKDPKDPIEAALEARAARDGPENNWDAVTENLVVAGGITTAFSAQHDGATSRLPRNEFTNCRALPSPFVGCSVDVAAEMFDTRVEHMNEDPKDPIEAALDSIMRYEEGYAVKDGVEKQHGVTLEMYEKWCEREGFADPALSDLMHLSGENARAVLYEECFSQTGLGWLPVEIQPFMLDSVVAHGVVKAVKILQGTINLGYSSDWLEEDGVCGPVTSSEAKLAQCKNGRFLLIMLISGRAAHYSRYAVSGEVLRSWLNRVEEFLP